MLVCICVCLFWCGFISLERKVYLCTVNVRNIWNMHANRRLVFLAQSQVKDVIYHWQENRWSQLPVLQGQCSATEAGMEGAVRQNICGWLSACVAKQPCAPWKQFAACRLVIFTSDYAKYHWFYRINSASKWQYT